MKDERAPRDRHAVYLVRQHRVGPAVWFELIRPGSAPRTFASWRALVHHLRGSSRGGPNAPPRPRSGGAGV